MSKGIGRLSIGGRASVARRQIAGRTGQADQGYVFAPKSGVLTTFSPPKAGYWKIVMNGPGGASNGVAGNGGGSGAYGEKTVYLSAGVGVPCTVGISGADTTLTLPDGTVLTAGSGGTPTGGVASGPFDFTYSGSSGGTLSTPSQPGLGPGGGSCSNTVQDSGAGAPGSLQFPGGDGFAVNGADAGYPGAGGARANTGPDRPGGVGRILFIFQRP
jgi:hypothetical protein